MAALRCIALGLLAGLSFSVLRAPAGLSLWQLPLPSASTRGLVRALALLVPALALAWRSLPRGRGAGPGLLLFGVASGLALHGLLIDPRLAPTSRVALLASALLLVIALGALSRHRTPADLSASRLPWLEPVGLGLSGAALVVSLDMVARPLRALGAGERWEVALTGCVLALSASLGAAALGARSQGSRARALQPLLLALVPLACLYSLVLLHATEERAGLLAALDILAPVGERLGLDLSVSLLQLGTPAAVAVLAARALFLPGFLLGAALGRSDAKRWAMLLFGAALGSALLPALYDARAALGSYDEVRAAAVGWKLARGAALLAAAGAGLVLCTQRELHSRARAALGLALLACATLPLLATPRSTLPLTPWSPVPVQAELVIDCADGYFAVARRADGTRVALLDGKRLTPTAEAEQADEARLAGSIELLTDSGFESSPDLLLLGLATPARSAAAQRLGFTRLERTSPWARWSEELEAALFVGSGEPPEGRLDIEGARARLDAARPLLVHAPPIRGPELPGAPAQLARWAATEPARRARFDAPESVAVMVWFDLGAELRGVEFGEHLSFAGPRLEDLAIGVLSGGLPGTGSLRAGDEDMPAGRGIGMGWERRRMQRAAAFARSWPEATLEAPPLVGEPSFGVLRSSLATGLALTLAAQQPSSPWVTGLEAVEVDADGLAMLCVVAHAYTLPRLLELIEHLAAVLTAKRLPEEVLAHLEPLATARAPWPALERAVGHAYAEFLEHERAAEWFERALASSPLDLGLWAQLAEARAAADDHAGAVEAWRSALAIQPGEALLERALALALWRAGDPGAEAALRASLERWPEDEELLGAMQQGPPPG